MSPQPMRLYLSSAVLAPPELLCGSRCSGATVECGEPEPSESVRQSDRGFRRRVRSRAARREQWR